MNIFKKYSKIFIWNETLNGLHKWKNKKGNMGCWNYIDKVWGYILFNDCSMNWDKHPKNSGSMIWQNKWQWTPLLIWNKTFLCTSWIKENQKLGFTQATWFCFLPSKFETINFRLHYDINFDRNYHSDWFYLYWNLYTFIHLELGALKIVQVRNYIL